MSRFAFVSWAVIFAATLFRTPAAGQEAEYTQGGLEFASTVSRDSLDAVTSVVVSQDGQFLYAAAWRAAAINVFSRDIESGELTPLQEIVDDEHLSGATSVRISPNGRYAIAPAFRLDSVTLYGVREDGKLEQLDSLNNDSEGVEGLDWCIDATFSNDSRFAYVSNGRGNTIATFEIVDDKLRFVEINAGIDFCFENVRGIVTHPKKNLLAAASDGANCLTVLEYDKQTGQTGIHELITDDNGEVSGLSGAMAAAISADGRNLYVSSGRFGGDNAVGAYEFDDDGRLLFLEEFFSDSDDREDEGRLKNFVGGNEIAVSPDGGHVYATGTVSSSVACFTRDVTSGQLTYDGTIGDVDGRVSGAAGICVSPDNRFVYVAAEDSAQISCFRRTVANESQDEE